MKKEKKSVNTMVEKKEEKLQTIKTDRFMKIGRFILWVVILFLIVRGIGSLLTPSSEIKMQQMITDYRADTTLRETVQIGATAFAEDFASEYYTYAGKVNSDYEKRVKRYTAEGLDLKSPVLGKYKTAVIRSVAENVDYQSKESIDVDVHLQVSYLPITEGEVPFQKDLYIRVPLSTNKRAEYAVTSYPVYIPQTDAGKIAVVGTYRGLQVDNSETEKIKETLNSFFSVYFGGTTNELSYYLAESSNLRKTAAGMVEYQRLDYATVCKEEGSGDYLVDTKFIVSDDGLMMPQRAFIRMEFSKKHYYVKSINTRPV